MKLTTKTLTVAMLATLFVGMFIGSALTWKCGRQKSTFTPVDTLLVIDHKTDTSVIYDTVVVNIYDTTFITPETPIGDIPARTQRAGFYVPIDVKTGNKTQRWNIPVEVGTTYRGILYQNTVRPLPEPYTVDLGVKRKIIDLYGTAAVGINWGLEMCGEMEIGLLFWDKVAVFGKVYADDWPVQIKPYAGLKYVIF